MDVLYTFTTAINRTWMGYTDLASSPIEIARIANFVVLCTVAVNVFYSSYVVLWTNSFAVCKR